MKQLIMTGPSQGADRTDIREIGEPRPGTGEVSIEVAYAGINFLDVMEVSGTVREVGPGVTGLAVGQRMATYRHRGPSRPGRRTPTR